MFLLVNVLLWLILYTKIMLISDVWCLGFKIFQEDSEEQCHNVNISEQEVFISNQGHFIAWQRGRRQARPF